MATANTRRIKKHESDTLKRRIDTWSMYGRNPTDCPLVDERVHRPDMDKVYRFQLLSLPRPKQLMVSARSKVQERYPDVPINDCFPPVTKVSFIITDPETEAQYIIAGKVDPNAVHFLPPHEQGIVPPDAPWYDELLAWAKLAAHQIWLTRRATPVVLQMLDSCSTYRQLQRLMPNLVPYFPSDVIDDLRKAARRSRVPKSDNFTPENLQLAEHWIAMASLLERHSFKSAIFTAEYASGRPPSEDAQSSSAVDDLGDLP